MKEEIKPISSQIMGELATATNQLLNARKVGAHEVEQAAGAKLVQTLASHPEVIPIFAALQNSSQMQPEKPGAFEPEGDTETDLTPVAFVIHESLHGTLRMPIGGVPAARKVLRT